MVTSKSDFFTWAPDTWQESGNSIKSFANSIDDAGGDMKDATSRADRGWDGVGFEGANDRTLADVRAISNVVSELEAAGDALVAAGEGVKRIKDDVEFVVTDLERTRYEVADDWTVTDVYPYSSPEERAELEPDRVRWASKKTDELRLSVGMADGIDSTQAENLTSALQNIDGLIVKKDAASLPIGEGLPEKGPDIGDFSAEQGREDAEAIANGTATPEQIERFEKARELTEEQKQALANGETISLPPQQIEYLQAFIKQVDDRTDGSGLDKLEAAAQFGGDNQAVKDAYADAVRLISNPSVTNGLQNVPPQILRAEGLQPFQGGIKELPQSYQDALLNQPMQLVGDDEPAGYEEVPEGTVVISGVPQLDRIRTIMQNGSDDTNSGSDINRLMLERTSEIADYVDGIGKTDFVIAQETKRLPNDYTNRMEDHIVNESISYDEMRDRLNNYVDVAGKDEVAVHDFLASGQPEDRGFGDPVSEMPGNSYTARDSWPVDLAGLGDMAVSERDPDRALNNLLTFDWNEENGGDSGMKNLLSGMGDPDRVFGSNGKPGPGAELSGQSAQIVAEYLGDNRTDLLNLPDRDRTSLGLLNPGVAEAAADGIGPHLIGLAGGAAENGATQGTGAMNGPEQMTNMFAVLDTSEGSATSINTWGAGANRVLQAQYAHGAEILGNGQVDGGGLGEVSARITNSMQDGLTLAANDLTHDERADIQNEYYQKGVAYDISRTAVKELVGFIPGAGSYLKSAVDLSSLALRGEAIGPPQYLGDYEAEASKILNDAQSPTVNSVQPRSTESLINLVNSSPDLEKLAGGTEISETNLWKFLDHETGKVDITKLKDDQDLREFRDAAEAVLGDLDDAWARDADTSQIADDWDGTYNERPGRSH